MPGQKYMKLMHPFINSYAAFKGLGLGKLSLPLSPNSIDSNQHIYWQIFNYSIAQSKCKMQNLMIQEHPIQHQRWDIS